jgi:hypothetical protein
VLHLPDLLLVITALGLPPVLGSGDGLLLLVENQLSTHEPLGLLLDFGLAGGGPLADAGLQLLEPAVLLRDALAQSDELALPLAELCLFELVLLGQLEPQLRDGLRHFGRRHAAARLRPELFRNQAHLERLPMVGEDFTADLLEAGFLPLDPLLPGVEPGAAILELALNRQLVLVELGALSGLFLRPGAAIVE